MIFQVFKQAVAKQFKAMSSSTLFQSTVDKDKLWELYLSSFPEGENPMYRTRTEYDCSCCRQFIRNIGGTVAVINGKMVSVWDDIDNPVAQALSAFVHQHGIQNLYFNVGRSVGTDKNFEQLVGSPVRTWDHFFLNLPSTAVLKGVDIGPKQSGTRATYDVLKRSIETISAEAVNTVLELIAQNSLYRGDEHKYAVTQFKAVLTNRVASDAALWQLATTLKPSVSRIRNTSIGTLLVDLSEGVELDEAVRKFEAMVAPANYKRPTALVTKQMVETAKAKIAELGLTSALERRYATLADITINNVIYADRSTKLKGDVFDGIGVERSPNLDKVEEISIEKFLKDVVPNATSIEIAETRSHAGNVVTLIAPVDATAGQLFKWSNGFSWSYAGDLADSVKERVKAAGGNVSGEWCNRLAWDNFDDLDFHMQTPNGEIFFRQKSVGGGYLDVDMNAGSGTTRSPVENIYFPNISSMAEGEYVLYVNQYTQRETKDVGFQVECDILGQVTRFVYNKKVVGKVEVARFNYTRKNGLKIVKSLPSESAELTFKKVNVIMNSPNHWDGQGVGNKHYFFMLDGAKNDGTARGFYNEFLREDLNAHRKVIEVVGSKMRTEESNNQLTGLGFSSTQRNTLICRVKGAFTRTVKILF